MGQVFESYHFASQIELTFNERQGSFFYVNHSLWLISVFIMLLFFKKLN